MTEETVRAIRALTDQVNAVNSGVKQWTAAQEQSYNEIIRRLSAIESCLVQQTNRLDNKLAETAQQSVTRLSDTEMAYQHHLQESTNGFEDRLGGVMSVVSACGKQTQEEVERLEDHVLGNLCGNTPNQLFELGANSQV